MVDCSVEGTFASGWRTAAIARLSMDRTGNRWSSTAVEKVEAFPVVSECCTVAGILEDPTADELQDERSRL